MKKLSIGIPTYNRMNSLKRTLAVIQKEIEGIEDEVEICVSDNCSQDETVHILHTFEDRLPLVWSSNKENLGFDKNIFRIIEMASGEYVWYLGDDDAIISGSLKRVLLDLKKYGNSRGG